MGVLFPLECKKEAKTVMIEFGENTTAHGVPRVTKARSILSHVFWICICLICVILFLFQAVFLIQRFFRYETTTQIELKFETVEFPAVTVCNINPYKNSLILNENSLQRMLTSFDRALSGGRGQELNAAPTQPRSRIPRQTKRNSNVLPAYAECDCSSDSTNCVPSYKPPPGGKPPCVCFYNWNAATAGPCYLEKFWHLSWCDCGAKDICKRADLVKLYSINESELFSSIEPCICANVTQQCIPTLDKKFLELWDLPIRTTPAPTSAPSTAESITVDPFEEAQSFENFTDPAAIAIQGKINLMFAIANMSWEAKKALSHEKEDLIRMCVFNRQQCNIERDFRLHVDPMYGNCYMFNFDSRFNKTNRAGPVFGLRLMLYLDVKEYMPLTQDLGARIAVHTAESFPFPDVFGYNAPAGVASSFGIRLKKVKRLEPPYGNCSSDAKSEDYIYENYTYSTEGCYRTCRQRALIKLCGCGEPRFPVSKNQRHCAADDPAARKCLEQAAEALGSVYGNIPDCHCPQPCEQAVYDATYSAAKWPSGAAHPSMLNCSGTISECTEHLRENGAAIEIFFEQLNCEYLKESEAYPWVNLLSDLGGQMGLWLGFSIITIVELLVLLWDLLQICFCRRKKPPPQPPKDTFANYNGDTYGPVSVECTLQLRSNSVY